MGRQDLEQPEDRAFPLRPVLMGGAIVLMTVAAYVPAIRGGFIWDDDDYVTGNPTLRDADGLRRIWLEVGAVPQYYPLVHTTFWVEHHLWMDWAPGYHAVNVLLHALNAVLLWRVLGRLKAPGAWWAAAVFALHPVEVESAAWITERKNVLSFAFYLGSVLAYFRFCGLGGSSVGARRRWGYYALAAALFLCALLSKTVAASMPAAMLLVIWWKRGRLTWRDVAAAAPLLAMGVGLGMLTLWVEKHRVGAEGEPWSLSAVDRVLVAGRALWFYVGKLVWPQELTFMYPRWEVQAGAWWQYLYPLAAVGALVSLWLLRGRIGRGPLAAGLFFAGTLAPALGFFNVYPMQFSFVADHFQYQASAGMIALIAGSIAWAGREAAAAARLGTWICLVGGSLVLAALGSLTAWQGRIYRDLETLWRDTIDKNPRCWMAYSNLAIILIHRQETEAAVPLLEKALELKKDFAEAHSNLGVALEYLGRNDQAIEHYRKALEIMPGYADARRNLELALAQKALGATSRGALSPADVSQAAAHYNAGNALAGQGKLDQAIESYLKALQINPRMADAHNNLAVVLVRRGRIPEAIQHYDLALRIDPNNAEGHSNLGATLLGLGQVEPAVEHFRRAIEIRPDYAEAQSNLGGALVLLGKAEEAVAHYRSALRINPNYASPAARLAWLLATCEDPNVRNADEAVRLAERACRLTNSSASAMDALAAAYAEAGRFPEAIDAAKAAVKSAVDSGDASLVGAARARLELYQSGKPWREKLRRRNSAA